MSNDAFGKKLLPRRHVTSVIRRKGTLATPTANADVVAVPVVLLGPVDDGDASTTLKDVNTSSLFFKKRERKKNIIFFSFAFVVCVCATHCLPPPATSDLSAPNNRSVRRHSRQAEAAASAVQLDGATSAQAGESARFTAVVKHAP